MQEEKLLKQLFKEILSYYKKIINNPSKEFDELINQDNHVEDVQVCFRIMCQVVDSFLQGYNDLQKQYKALEEQLISKENETRKHIQIEQQLKIYAEDLQDTCEQMQKQLEHSNAQILVPVLLNQELSKEIVKMKKKTISSQERLITDTTQDRLSTIISQQKANQSQKTKKKLQTNTKKSLLQLTQTIKVEKSNATKKKKSTSQLKQRSNTIHVTEQPKQSRMRSIHLNDI